MKALVTGGAGFIGSSVASLLQTSGWTVRVLDNFSTGHRTNLAHIDCEILEGDIRDRDLMRRACTGIDAVFHLAASIGNKRSLEFPQDDSDINVVGTVNLLDAARQRGVRAIVYSSSAAIFGELLTDRIAEDHPQHPTSPYGASKLGAEKQVECFGRLYGMTTICLRYFNVYGVRQRFDEYGNVIPIFARRLLRGEPLVIYGDGEQTRDFVNVTDVARTNVTAASYAGGSTVINVGCGSRITVNALISHLEHASGRTAERRYVAPRAGEVRHCEANIERLRTELGMAPSTDIASGLREYWDWVVTEHEIAAT